jgi:hypothetical protein
MSSSLPSLLLPLKASRHELGFISRHCHRIAGGGEEIWPETSSEEENTAAAHSGRRGGRLHLPLSQGHLQLARRRAPCGRCPGCVHERAAAKRSVLMGGSLLALIEVAGFMLNLPSPCPNLPPPTPWPQ